MTQKQINAILKQVKRTKTDAEKKRLLNQLPKKAVLKELRNHLQTAVEVELSTIPLYLYAYYSINRQPTIPSSVDPDRAEALKTYANKAGGIIMSVAVEEMLHMSLASNILFALGGQPRLYGKSPGHYPTNLLHHKKGFEVALQKFSSSQLAKFLWIENPEKKEAPPEGNQWDTLGQFYDYIALLINTEHITDADFKQGSTAQQIQAENLPPNNTDTTYPKTATYAPQDGAKVARYPNAPDAHVAYTNPPPPPNFPQSELVTINTKTLALEAIRTICEQGEGYPENHTFDDKSHDEESHYWKFLELRAQLEPDGDPPPPPKRKPKLTVRPPFSEEELRYIVYPFPDEPKASTTGKQTSPTTASYPQAFQAYSDLCNGIYQYLLLMTEMTFQVPGEAQKAMFHIGMHKGMIFILDKVIGAMRYHYLNGGTDGPVLAPTFENFKFNTANPKNPCATAKRDLVRLYNNVPASQQPGYPGYLDRIKDLPDVNVGVDGYVSFAFADALA